MSIKRHKGVKIAVVSVLTCVLFYLVGMKRISMEKKYTLSGSLNDAVANPDPITSPPLVTTSPPLVTTSPPLVTTMACNKVPDALIIGFAKCGTKTLKRFLNVHPEIFALEEEHNDLFFNEGINVTFETYENDRRCIPKGMVKLEKMSVGGVPRRVYEMNPNIKLLVIVKDPVIRTVSHFVQQVVLGYEKNGTFDQLINAILDKDAKKTTYTSILFTQGLYNMKLEPWFPYFNKSSFHVVDGDKFVKDPVSELSKVEEFLGVKHYITSQNFVFNPTKGFYCIRNDLEEECMDSRKGRPHPKVDLATVKRLKEFFWQHNEDFFALFEKRYSWNDDM